MAPTLPSLLKARPTIAALLVLGCFSLWITTLPSNNPHSGLPNTDSDKWRDTKAAIVDMFGSGESQNPFDSSPKRPHVRLVIERAQKRYESVLAKRKAAIAENR